MSSSAFDVPAVALGRRPPPPWGEVVPRTFGLLKAAMPHVPRLRAGCWGLPRVRHHVLLDPTTGDVHVGLGGDFGDKVASLWEGRFRRLGFGGLAVAPLDVPPAGFGERPWVWVKQAVDPTLHALAQLLRFQPSAVDRVIGGPSPLAATLASGLLGAGLGYGAGSIAELGLPRRDFTPGVLRRNMALAGGALGAAPGALWGLTSQGHHPEGGGLKAWLSGWPFRAADSEGRPYGEGHSPIKEARDALRACLPGLDPWAVLDKRAYSFMGDASPASAGVDALARLPSIPRDEFGRAVLADANTPLPVRYATLGLLHTASSANGGSPLVSPMDIARVAAGGLRGLLVGKTLGALAGLRPEAQEQLQRQGVWAELLSSVVPNAFAGPVQAFSM